ncbi:hypothetical protein [Haloarcula nitratireducens]|uniref:Uncharacterized protein n=1 Tax=Haloarcula nitratireducens TaxID=2487749 RepID=A0AAW4PBB7_9EURY|nr:hypothetical protein [Halomicroarcula nitratireducens]MBX0295031.1 hypothetical protein [Halomicroarcula nitratireducens]
MFRAFVRRFVDLLTRGDDADESGNDGFARSRLDASVNESHGESGREAAREMADVQRQAELLGERERHRR